MDAWVAFPTRSYPTINEPPRLDPLDEGRTDKGKGKVRAVDSDDTHQPEPESVSMEDDAFTDTLRETMTVSRRASSRIRSPDEASPSGSSNSTLTSDTTPPPCPTLLPHIHPSGSGSEHAKTDRVILISFLWYIKKFIPFEPTSSFLVVLIFTCPQHRLSRIKSS